jgi:hypothetical protein
VPPKTDYQLQKSVLQIGKVFEEHLVNHPTYEDIDCHSPLVHFANAMLARGTCPYLHFAHYLAAASPFSNCWVHPRTGFQTNRLDFVVAV